MFYLFHFFIFFFCFLFSLLYILLFPALPSCWVLILDLICRICYCLFFVLAPIHCPSSFVVFSFLSLFSSFIFIFSSFLLYFALHFRITFFVSLPYFFSHLLFFSFSTSSLLVSLLSFPSSLFPLPPSPLYLHFTSIFLFWGSFFYFLLFTIFFYSLFFFPSFLTFLFSVFFFFFSLSLPFSLSFFLISPFSHSSLLFYFLFFSHHEKSCISVQLRFSFFIFLHRSPCFSPPPPLLPSSLSFHFLSLSLLSSTISFIFSPSFFFTPLSYFFTHSFFSPTFLFF